MCVKKIVAAKEREEARTDLKVGHYKDGRNPRTDLKVGHYKGSKYKDVERVGICSGQPLGWCRAFPRRGPVGGPRRVFHPIDGL